MSRLPIRSLISHYIAIGVLCDTVSDSPHACGHLAAEFVDTRGKGKQKRKAIENPQPTFGMGGFSLKHFRTSFDVESMPISSLTPKANTHPLRHWGKKYPHLRVGSFHRPVERGRVR